MNGWGGQILCTSAAALVAEQLPAVEPPGVAIEQMLDGMQRQGTFAELAARQGTRLQEHEIEVLLGQSSKVAGLVTRARLRVACEAAERGLQECAASDRPGAAHVGDVRGRGLALGVELVDADGRPDPALTAKAVFAGWLLGVVAYPVRDNVIEVTPALIIGEDEVETAVRLLGDAIDSAAAGEVSDEDVAPYGGW